MFHGAADACADRVDAIGWNDPGLFVGASSPEGRRMPTSGSRNWSFLLPVTPAKEYASEVGYSEEPPECLDHPVRKRTRTLSRKPAAVDRVMAAGCAPSD